MFAILPGFLGGVVAGGGGGGSYPAMTLTSPTFASNGKFGSQTLSGGSGTATVTVGNACGLGMWFACVGSHYGTFLQAQGLVSVGKAFNAAEVSFDGGSQVLSSNTPPSTASGTATINEGAWHWFYLARDGLTGTARWWVDGVAQTPNVALSNQSNTLTININPTVEPDGAWFDEIVVWNGTDDSRATPPTAAMTRDANTVVIWNLNGTGTGT